MKHLSCKQGLSLAALGLSQLLLFAAQAASGPGSAPAFRPPSVPLVPCDPYFSIWSPADDLAGADTVHWTGKPNQLSSLVRIDSKTFRLMGAEPSNLTPFKQTGLEISPTTTTYHFEGEGVELGLSFIRPALPENLDLLSSPFVYIQWTVKALDGRPHDVQVYFDAAGELAVDHPSQPVVWSSEMIEDIQKGSARKSSFRLKTGKRGATAQLPVFNQLSVLKIGSEAQPVLQRKGDDLRIEWGYLYLATGTDPLTCMTVGSAARCRDAFVWGGAVNLDMDQRMPRAANDQTPVAAVSFNFRNVAGSGTHSQTVILAYDDLYSIQYFKHNLRPYWRRTGWTAQNLLRAAARDYPQLVERCREFDQDLMSTLVKAGGREYAGICALAYRQCLAANKIVADAKGQPLMFPKENFSNGCIGTVDVIYPMAPQFLFLNPSLAKAMLVPILDYAASERWRWPFAPHDLGTYPLANGQVYGGGERTEENQMPVEETGNMLLLLDAIAVVDGDARFCSKYWPVLDKWADYLKAKGFDPENQLCTDDFAGHLAHNVNLSAKAICGLGAYSQLCALRGDKARAREALDLAKQFAQRWVKEADDSDHYRLAFDKPGTWSQKYNLVWDRILDLNLFPRDVAQKEMTFYKSKQNTYGLPLDNRKDYTKLDWTLWTATLTQEPADFQALVAPVYKFLNESPSRVPMTDWYDTRTGKKVGFQARSVVGGVFLQMLYDRAEWKNRAAQDQARPSRWAPLPQPPKIAVVLPTSEETPASWRFTLAPQTDGWFKPGFDDTAWKEAPGGFGTQGTPGSVVRTRWNTKDIWLRRQFSLDRVAPKELQLRIHHDEDAEVYLNGNLAATLSGYVTSYETVPIQPKAAESLKKGQNLLSVHCKQTGGGQYIDVGLVEVK